MMMMMMRWGIIEDAEEGLVQAINVLLISSVYQDNKDNR